MHAVSARKAVEAVVMEATMAALRAIRNDAGMVSLEAVAKEAPKVAVCELRKCIVAHETEAEAEAQMYFDDAAAEESRDVTTVVVAAGRTSAWLLVDGDETEVKDDDKDEEAEAERDVELHAADAAIHEAATQCDAELAARTSEEHYVRRRMEDLAESRVKVEAVLAAAEAAECEVVERAAHWAAEMDKALAYRRDVDRRKACRRT
jgi:hypothetical protein